MTDVFAIQSDVSRRVARSLAVELLPGQQGRLVRAGPVKGEAYRLYLKGRYLWNQRSIEGLRRSLEHFEQAIALDPSMAVAWAALADAYVVLTEFCSMPSYEGFPPGREAALKALELDDSLAEAHTVFAQILHFHDWDVERAEAEFLRAIELNPSYATAHQWYGELLMNVGRHEEARDSLVRAYEIDPHSPMIHAEFAGQSYYARQYERAIDDARRTIEREPDFWVGHFELGLALDGNGRYAEAIDAFERAVRLSDGHLLPRAGAARAYALRGERDRALEIANDLRRSEEGTSCPSTVAVVYAALGDYETAFLQLEEAVRVRDSELIRNFHAVVFDDLRSDSRYRDLMRRVGLPFE